MHNLAHRIRDVLKSESNGCIHIEFQQNSERSVRFPMSGLRTITTTVAIAISVLLCCGCIPKAEREVVVYSALDREFSEPILNDYEKRTGVSVLPKYDVESTKTVGLVTAIIEEQRRPRCDVFWNNEMLHTLRLEQLGLLDVYLSPAAKHFPSDYVAESRRWHGFASRARVLIVNTEKLSATDEWPNSVEDLVDPRWENQCAIAKPLFGTTATHAAVLFDRWGEERATDFFTKVSKQCAVLSGNKQVAVAVGRGDYAFGITDTDDAIIELEQGKPVALVFPDQADGKPGTLFIPNSICIMRAGPNPEEARHLVDFLLSPEVEERLAKGPSAQFPVNPQVSVDSRANPEEPVRWMEVDFRAAAEEWDKAVFILTNLFQTAG